MLTVRPVGRSVRMVKHGWFILAAVLAIGGYLIESALGGLLMTAAFVAFIVGTIRTVRDRGGVDDRAAGAGFFGGWF